MNTLVTDAAARVRAAELAEEAAANVANEIVTSGNHPLISIALHREEIRQHAEDTDPAAYALVESYCFGYAYGIGGVRRIARHGLEQAHPTAAAILREGRLHFIEALQSELTLDDDKELPESDREHAMMLAMLGCYAILDTV